MKFSSLTAGLSYDFQAISGGVIWIILDHEIMRRTKEMCENA